MAKKKKPAKRSAHRANPKKTKHRRRRNPSGDFASRLGKLATITGVAVASAVGVYFGQAKIAPGNPMSLYGIPAGVFLLGVGIARKMPTIGAGLAIGAPAPFALPLASKLLAATNPTPATTAAGVGRAYRSMRAIDMSGRRLGAVHLGAVHPGSQYG